MRGVGETMRHRSHLNPIVESSGTRRNAQIAIGNNLRISIKRRQREREAERGERERQRKERERETERQRVNRDRRNRNVTRSLTPSRSLCSN
jgi:hypothetical protein